jgi:chemotaxis protein CheD
MTQRYDQQLKSEVITIHPGEHYSTNEDVVIATLLGSCIAVALYDEKEQQGGLNHFMLDRTLIPKNDITGNIGRFGMYAMEILINELMKAGSQRKNLVAKVFGGGSILQNTTGNINKIPQDNIDFAINYLKTEKIPVIAQDVGGPWPRKVFFYPVTAKVLLKHITKQVDEVVAAEASYRANQEKQLKKQGEVVLF